MVGLPRKVIYGHRTFTDSIKQKRSEQSHADPRLFRRFVDGKGRRLIVGYVGDILLANKLKDDEPTLSELRSCFKIENVDEAEVYIDRLPYNTR